MPSISRTGPLSPEVLVPRLGDSLVEKGLLKQEELKQALAYQKEKRTSGERVLLGQALVELGLIDRQKLDAAVTEQIAQLQEALHQSNLLLEQRVQERTAELQEALNKLTELNRMKNDFISNVSHELRTPLAHMVGYIDLLSAEALGPVSDDQRSALGVLEKSYKRLASLIDNLLFLSFDTAETLHLEPEAVDLKDLFHQVVEQYQPRASNESISLTQEVPSGLPQAHADINRLEWALGQLVDNALKFNTRDGRVHINARQEGQRIEVAVADTGIGIPEDKLQEIFEPFHQLDSSSTRRHAGTGIGLTLARRIIEGHGAKLLVESFPGQGSRFSFSLPVAGAV
ncbi:MAG: ATP-binding protein [Anaerolineales bacterium]|nr:MAG: ATP-binding protein [Anaerolineales bacterium]